MGLFIASVWHTPSNPIRIGVLHNSTESYRSDDTMTVTAIEIAVAEINQSGGINEREVEIVYRDSADSNQRYAQNMQELIDIENVDVVFGCPSIECYAQTRDLVEKSDSMLFYSGESLGGQANQRIFTMGALPSQVYPLTIDWAEKNFGQRALFIAQKSRYSQFSFVLAQKQMQALGGELDLIFFDSDDTLSQASFIRTLRQYQPDFVINAVQGDANSALFNWLRDTNDNLPIISTRMTTSALEAINLQELQQSYVVSSYLSTQTGVVNQRFVEAMQQEAGSSFIPETAVSSYSAVHLWANTVRNVGTIDPDLLISAIDLESYTSPSGIIIIDNNNQATWRNMYIGEYTANGEAKAVWTSSKSIQPLLLPLIGKESHWKRMLSGKQVLGVQ
jgi:urea transport system substrate-binding protein